MERERLLVAGNGMVGQKLLEELVTAGLHEHYHITVLCEEPQPAYDRLHLSTYFTGCTAADLSLVPDGFFEENGIELRLGEKVASIDVEARTATTSCADVLPYDKLVIATGSYPFVPPVPGSDREGCMVYRTFEDLDAIKKMARTAETGVVVGGGLLGLEAVKALHDAGLQTYVVEFAPRLMSIQIDDTGGRFLRRRIEQLGVCVHTGKNTQEISDGEFYRHRLRFADGEELEADLVVFSAGIRPRDELARKAGLKVGEKGGIAIDDHCRTSNPDVYAVGECALWRGRIFGLAAPGYQMARAAVQHLQSLRSPGYLPAPFPGAETSARLKLMGVDVASLGDAHAQTPGACSYHYVDERKQIYKKLVVSEDGRFLLGGVLVGDAREYGTLLQLMLNRVPLPDAPQELILPPRAGIRAPALDASALPDEATLCACQSVSKAAICRALGEGNNSLEAISACTGAATGCGSCAPMVESLIQAEGTAEAPVGARL